jgi:hypothetical protein
MIDLHEIARIDLIRVLAEGHICQIQQPTHFQIVGELLQVFVEMLNSSSRTRRKFCLV